VCAHPLAPLFDNVAASLVAVPAPFAGHISIMDRGRGTDTVRITRLGYAFRPRLRVR
jgi:hypothetical protein